MPSEPRWLEPADIIELNCLIVEQTGEAHFLREYGLLESALYRPRFLHYYEGEEDVVALAMALLFGIAENHCFEQGNKRTAFEAAVEFARLNGYDLDIPDNDTIAEALIAALNHDLTEQDFGAALRVYFKPIVGG